MNKVYLIIGCPGSGKSWVCNQLKDKFEYCPNDEHIGQSSSSYLSTIAAKAKAATKPILAEAPFSISQVIEPLRRMGLMVTPIFIQEHPSVIRERYTKREGLEKAGRLLPGHLNRQTTYQQRAKDWNAFEGTSKQVLDHLRTINA